MNAAATKSWQQYERGKEYKIKLNLFDNVDLVERFYAGDQWYGVTSNGLPTPVFNIIKRIINYQIAAIMSQKIKLAFAPSMVPESKDNDTLAAKAGQAQQDPALAAAQAVNGAPAQPGIPITDGVQATGAQPTDMKKICEIVNDQCEQLWERLQMDSQVRHALRDAAISGDMANYNFFNMDLLTSLPIAGKEPVGDIDSDLVDNVQVYFGNPNERRTERQPYILVAFREMVSKLRAEAKKNKVSEEDIARIVGDTENKETSGDRGKIELEGTNDDEEAKATVILKFWRDPITKDILWTKATQSVEIISSRKLGGKKYPIAWSSWDFRKNSYHGQSVGLELIPNQTYINKAFAMVMKSMMDTAFPKIIYNKTLLPGGWDNRVDKAIGVFNAEDMKSVATVLQGAQFNAQILQTIEMAIQFTKDFVGATDAALGDIRPDNHAAIVAVQQASMVPLETVKSNLYQWVEDIGYIWLDMMAYNYGPRVIVYNGQEEVFDFSQLQKLKLRLKIDVGPSSYWSEIAAAQTLDGLLQQERIDFVQYLERMPHGYIPQTQELIEDMKTKAENEANKPPQTEPPKVTIAFSDLPIKGKIFFTKQYLGIDLTEQDFMQQAAMDQQYGSPLPKIEPGGGIRPPEEGATNMESVLAHMPPELAKKLAGLPPEKQMAIIQAAMQGGGAGGAPVPEQMTA